MHSATSSPSPANLSHSQLCVNLSNNESSARVLALFDRIAAEYPHWNRTANLGLRHFLVFNPRRSSKHDSDEHV